MGFLKIIKIFFIAKILLNKEITRKLKYSTNYANIFVIPDMFVSDNCSFKE